MKLKGTEAFYALICDDSKYVMNPKERAQQLLCGVFATVREADRAAKEVKDCPCEHYIKKCAVTITY